MPQQSRNAYIWLEKGISHFKAKRYRDCLVACEQAIQLDSNCARAYHGKGLALANLKEHEEALAAYKEALHLAPENPKLYADLAELFYYSHDYKNSGLFYRKAIQLDSKFEPIYAEQSKKLLDNASHLLTPYIYILDTLNSALNAFRDVLLFNPDEATASVEIGKIQKQRGESLVKLQKSEDAIEAFSEASQLNPNDAKLHAALGELYYHKGNYEISRLSYKKAIQLDSEFEPIYTKQSKKLLDDAFYLLTSHIHTLDTLNSGLNAFRNVLLFNPNEATATVEIGKIQKVVEKQGNCDIHYKGLLFYKGTSSNSASITIYSNQSDEEVRIFFFEKENDRYIQIQQEASPLYFSKIANDWIVTFTFPVTNTFPPPGIDFRIEVFHHEVVIAYGYYWNRSGYLGRDKEYNIYLSISYDPETLSSKGPSSNREFSEWQGGGNRERSDTLYVPNRTRGRNRRVRRGS